MDRFTPGHPTKPLLVAGHGIRLSGAQNELKKVLKMGIPVVTTFNGFDLVPNDHPCFVGRIGTIGTYGGNNALKKCDMLICVGTRNNIRQVSYDWKSFAPQARKIVVDIDGEELKKYLGCSLMNNDAKNFLKLMLASKLNIKSGWLDSLKKYNEDHPVKLSTPYKFIHDLTKLLPKGSVAVCGNGTACVCMFQAGIVKNKQRIFWNSGCAAMGYDMPAAIGAHYGSGKDVVCITGDGSIQMNIQELQTIRHHNLPIKIFVLNNNGYRSIELTQSKYFDGDYIGCNARSGVSFPDLVKIAETYNLPYYLGDGDNMENTIQKMLGSRGAALCEVMIGNDYEFKPKWTRGY